MAENPPPHLLVVDDSPAIRKMMIASLRPLDAQITEAGSGLAAIEQMGLAHFDLLLLDINMPDMHGLEFLRFLRGLSGYRTTPVIVVTSSDDEDLLRTIQAEGASLIVPKPFTPEKILSTVRAYLPV